MALLPLVASALLEGQIPELTGNYLMLLNVEKQTNLGKVALLSQLRCIAMPEWSLGVEEAGRGSC